METGAQARCALGKLSPKSREPHSMQPPMFSCTSSTWVHCKNQTGKWSGTGMLPCAMRIPSRNTAMEPGPHHSWGKRHCQPQHGWVWPSTAPTHHVRTLRRDGERTRMAPPRTRRAYCPKAQGFWRGISANTTPAPPQLCPAPWPPSHLPEKQPRQPRLQPLSSLTTSHCKLDTCEKFLEKRNYRDQIIFVPLVSSTTPTRQNA